MSQAWVKLSACKDMDTADFYPSVEDTLAIAMATTVCFSCPVRLACLDYARLHKIRDGIWGGVFLERPSRRRKLRRCSRCGSTHLFRWEKKYECSDCRFSWAV